MRRPTEVVRKVRAASQMVGMVPPDGLAFGFIIRSVGSRVVVWRGSYPWVICIRRYYRRLRFYDGARTFEMFTYIFQYQARIALRFHNELFGNVVQRLAVAILLIIGVVTTAVAHDLLALLRPFSGRVVRFPTAVRLVAAVARKVH